MTKPVFYVGSNEIELKFLGGTQYEVGGALVLFGDGIKSADFERDWFAPDTDFDLADDGTGTSAVYFNHGLDTFIGKQRLGKGKAALTKDDRAVWIRHQLDIANEYDAMVVELIQERQRLGKSFGWSSGVASHLVERQEQPDGSYKITKWGLGSDASITLIPNDWRQVVGEIAELRPTNAKTLLNAHGDSTIETQTPEAHNSDGDMPSSAVDDDTVQAEQKTVHDIPEIEVIMSEETRPEGQEPQAPPALDALEAKMAAMEKAVSATMDAMTKMMEAEPRINRGGWVTQDGGTADTSIKNVGDMMLAIKRGDHKRLTEHYGLKAQTEGDGAQGGYYVPDAVLADLMPNLSLVSGLGQLVTRIPVSLPAGEMPIPDYSRVPTADAGNSASAQGIESQARAEGGAYTEETAYVEMLQYRVSDAASGYVKASREISQDWGMIQNMLQRAIQNDVTNKEEFFFLRGSGVNQPLGVLNAACLIQVTEDTDNTFAIADRDEMVSKFLQVGNNSTAWVHHPYVHTQIAALERGTGGSVYDVNLAGALPTSLAGHPRFKSQHLPNVGTDGYIILGDWSQYVVFERGGLYIEFSEHADFLNGNNVWRFGKRIDGKPLFTAAVTLADGSSTVSPFVAIKNKT